MGPLQDAKNALIDQTEALKEIGEQDYVLEFLKKWGNLNRLSTEEVKAATKELIEYKKEMVETTAVLTKANSDLGTSFSNLGKAIDEDLTKLPKLKNYQIIMLELENIKSLAETTAIGTDQLASGFLNLSKIQQSELGITNLVNGLEAWEIQQLKLE